MSAWALNFLDAEGPTPTFNILSGNDHGIREAFTYRKRHEHGTSIRWIRWQTRSGTCRDYALFMIEALRRLGIAARFVSGYLFISRRSFAWLMSGRFDHAWVQVYLPSAAWIEFDPPTASSVPRSRSCGGGARSAPGDTAARPYLGSADAFVGMEVSITLFRRCSGGGVTWKSR